jgi:hypothetical protein
MHAMGLYLVWSLNMDKYENDTKVFISVIEDFFEEGTFGFMAQNLVLLMSVSQEKSDSISKSIQEFNLDFNCPLRNADFWNLLMETLKLSRSDHQESFLTEISYLVVQNIENCQKVSSVKNWQSRLIRFLPFADQCSNLAYSIISTVIFHEIVTVGKSPFKSSMQWLLNELCAASFKFPDVFSRFQAQRLFFSVLLKLQASLSSFGNMFSSLIYENLILLLDIVIEFVFCSPLFGKGLTCDLLNCANSSKKEYGIHFDDGILNDSEIILASFELLRKLKVEEFGQNMMPNLQKTELNMLSLLKQKYETLKNASAFLVILQFKFQNLSKDLLQDLIKKLYSSASTPKVTKLVFHPLAEIPTHIWFKGEFSQSDFDKYVLQRFTLGAESVLELFNSKLSLRSLSKSGNFYPHCFLASEAISLLLDQKFVKSESDALMICNILQSAQIFEPFNDDEPLVYFRNKPVLYIYAKNGELRSQSVSSSSPKDREIQYSSRIFSANEQKQ